MANMLQRQARHWCFTKNNYAHLLSWEECQEIGAVFLVYQEEIGPSGTPHLQGTISFRTPKRGTQVSAVLHGSPHLEVCFCLGQQIFYPDSELLFSDT